MERPANLRSVLDLHPMILAVEVEQHGRWMPGRVGQWHQAPDGTYWVHFGAEHRSSGHGGWWPAEDLRPGRHEVRTANRPDQWWAWEPPTWPAGLEWCADAAWNESEREWGIQSRPDGWLERNAAAQAEFAAERDARP